MIGCEDVTSWPDVVGIGLVLLFLLAVLAGAAYWSDKL